MWKWRSPEQAEKWRKKMAKPFFIGKEEQICEIPKTPRCFLPSCLVCIVVLPVLGILSNQYLIHLIGWRHVLAGFLLGMSGYTFGAFMAFTFGQGTYLLPMNNSRFCPLIQSTSKQEQNLSLTFPLQRKKCSSGIKRRKQGTINIQSQFFYLNKLQGVIKTDAANCIYGSFYAYGCQLQKLFQVRILSYIFHVIIF